MLDKLNIHYSSATPPTSTSKLWVKADVSPSKVIITKELASQPQTVSLLSTYQYNRTATTAYCQVDNKLYFGYSSPPTNETMKLRYYDLISHTFGTTNIVLPRIAFEAYAAIGHIIYMFGGQIYSASSTTDATVTKNIYAINLDTETITLLDTQLPNTGYTSMSPAVIGDTIYLFGGTGPYQAQTNIILQFNSVTKECLKVASLPRVCAPTAFVVNNQVYLVGGMQRNDYHSDQIYIFNPTTLQVTNTGITGLPHISTRGAVIGTDIYIFGGEVYDHDPWTSRTNINQIYRINTVQNTVSLLSTTLPQTNANQITGVMNSDIYILAGAQHDPYTICQFHATVDLPENNLLLTDLGAYSWDLFADSKLDVDIRPQKIYLGNAENEAQEVTAALYINDQWQNL